MPAWSVPNVPVTAQRFLAQPRPSGSLPKARLFSVSVSESGVLQPPTVFGERPISPFSPASICLISLGALVFGACMFVIVTYFARVNPFPMQGVLLCLWNMCPESGCGPVLVQPPHSSCYWQREMSFYFRSSCVFQPEGGEVLEIVFDWIVWFSAPRFQSLPFDWRV